MNPAPPPVQMTDYEDHYQQELEGVGHTGTTVYRVSSHHAFEHNGSSSSRSSNRSPSVESTESNPPAVPAGEQTVRHWTYEEQFRQVGIHASDVLQDLCND